MWRRHFSPGSPGLEGGGAGGGGAVGAGGGEGGGGVVGGGAVGGRIPLHEIRSPSGRPAKGRGPARAWEIVRRRLCVVSRLLASHRAASSSSSGPVHSRRVWEAAGSVELAARSQRLAANGPEVMFFPGCFPSGHVQTHEKSLGWSSPVPVAHGMLGYAPAHVGLTPANTAVTFFPVTISVGVMNVTTLPAVEATVSVAPFIVMAEPWPVRSI